MKRELLEKLLDLTKQQAVALEEDNLKEFKKLINRKKGVMKKIDELHLEHPELKAQKEEELLKEIIDLDKKNQEEFNSQLQDAKKNLAKLRSGRQVSDVYTNPYDLSREEGILFDKRNR